MDIDLPYDWHKYDEYADSEFLVHFSVVTDDEYWKQITVEVWTRTTERT